MTEETPIELDSSFEGIDEPPAKRPLLESVGHCFQYNRVEREVRIAREESKRQAEKVHAQFIRQNVACPVELAKANYVVSTWAKINGVKAEPKKRKRNILSKLNNQTATSCSLPQRNQTSHSSENSPRSCSSKSSVTEFTSTPKTRKPRSARPPLAEVLKISDLTIRNKNPLELDNRQEAVDLISLGSDNDNLPASNKNQSSSGSDRSKEIQPGSNSVNEFVSNQDADNQSVSESERSVSERLDSSVIIVSENKSLLQSPQGQYTCRVLHCETVFTSQAKLNHHMNQFRHSPCNPCLRAKDGKLLPDPICYMCPECDGDFKTSDECRDHMRSQKHLPYLPPLRIAGYICPQCLAIFESFETCWDHISELSHRFVSYPFLDDLKGPQPVEVGPVAIPEELAMDFMEKCSKIPFKVQCLECSLEIQTALMLRQHMAETNRQHPVSSLADCNPVDIFADYLAEFQCSSCYRLFTSYVPTHYCGGGVQGTVIENSVKSFHDFIKSCALTLTPVDPESSSSTDCAGPHQGQSLCLGNLIQVVQHCPEKGAIPKISKTTSTSTKTSYNKSPQSKRCQNTKTDNSDAPVIVVDTPPDPPRSSLGNMLTTQAKKETHDADKDKDKGKKLRFQLDSDDNATDKPNSQSEKQFTCTTKFQNFVNVISASCPTSSTEVNKDDTPWNVNMDSSPGRQGVNKGYVPVDVKAGESPGKRRHEDENEARKGQRTRTATGASAEREESESHRERSRSPTSPNPTATENLVKMKNIIFLDLDNWPGFFSKLPKRLPDWTFVWGFYGGKVVWKEPTRCYAFTVMKSKNLFYLHDRCGHTKDAADFAIVLTVGQMHERLPKHIPFTIVSGDKGFIEVERQMRDSNRKAVVIDPHSAQQFSEDMIYTMVTSVSDT